MRSCLQSPRFLQRLTLANSLNAEPSINAPRNTKTANPIRSASTISIQALALIPAALTTKSFSKKCAPMKRPLTMSNFWLFSPKQAAISRPAKKLGSKRSITEISRRLSNAKWKNAWWPIPRILSLPMLTKRLNNARASYILVLILIHCAKMKWLRLTNVLKKRDWEFHHKPIPINTLKSQSVGLCLLLKHAIQIQLKLRSRLTQI